MKALNGKRKPRPDPRGHEAQRKGLLAKIHIAKKELGLSDIMYEDILVAHCGKPSAAYASISQLEKLDKYFQSLGWKPQRSSKLKAQSSKQSQVDALRERVRAIAGDLENGEKRLDGLVWKICGVDCLDWCWDVGKLNRLVAVLNKIDD